MPTFEEITNPPRRVRVIETGEVYEIEIVNYEDEFIRTKGWDTFYFDEVVFLTPVQYAGVWIGIDDDIKARGKWRKVYDFSWAGNEWGVDAYNEKVNDCEWFTLSEIEGHHLKGHSTEKDKWLEQGKKEGWVKDGGIVV